MILRKNSTKRKEYNTKVINTLNSMIKKIVDKHEYLIYDFADLEEFISNNNSSYNNYSFMIRDDNYNKTYYFDCVSLNDNNHIMSCDIVTDSLENVISFEEKHINNSIPIKLIINNIDSTHPNVVKRTLNDKKIKRL